MNTLSDPRYLQSLNAVSVPNLNLNVIHKEQPQVIGRKIQSLKTLQTRKTIKKKPENLIKDKRQFKSRRDISVPNTEKLKSVTATDRTKIKRLKSPKIVKSDKPTHSKKPNKVYKASPPAKPKRGVSVDKRRQPSQVKQAEVKTDKFRESKIKFQECTTMTLRMVHKEKEEQLNYDNLNIQKEVCKKERLRYKNEEIRRVKSKERLHNATWGVDQKLLTHDEDTYRDQELELQKLKKREERVKVIQKRRTRIGLDLIPDYQLRTTRKSKSRERKTKEKPSSINKNTNSDIKKYIKQKKRDMKIAELLRLKEELEKEVRRDKELEELNNKQKKLVKKPSRKIKRLKSRSPDQEVKLTLLRREPSERNFEYRDVFHHTHEENKHVISDLHRKKEVDIPASHFAYLDNPNKKLSKPGKVLKERVENKRNAQIKSIHLSTFNSSENITHNIPEEGNSNEESKIAEAMQRSRDMLLRRLEALKDRVHSTGAYLRTEDFSTKESAAFKIQKWWRALRDRQMTKLERNYSKSQQESMTKTEFSILKALLKHEERINVIKSLRKQSPLPEYSVETPNSQDESLELPYDAKSIDLNPREDTHHMFLLERSEDFVEEESESIEENDWHALLEPQAARMKSDLVEKFRESLQQHYQELEKKLQQNQITVQAQLDEIGSFQVEESLLRTHGTDRFSSEGSTNLHPIIRTTDTTSPVQSSQNSARNPPERLIKSNKQSEPGLKLDIDSINGLYIHPLTIEDEKENEPSSSQITPSLRLPIKSIDHYPPTVISIQNDRNSAETNWIYELVRRNSQRSISHSSEKVQSSGSNLFDFLARVNSRDSNTGKILIKDDEESVVMRNTSFHSSSQVINYNLRYNFDEGEELLSFQEENQLSDIKKPNRKHFDFSNSEEDYLEENSGYLDELLKKNLKIELSDYEDQSDESYSSINSIDHIEIMNRYIPENQDISPIFRNEQFISSRLMPSVPYTKPTSHNNTSQSKAPKVSKVPVLKLELLNSWSRDEPTQPKLFIGSTSSIDKSSISYNSDTSNFLENIGELNNRKEASPFIDSSQDTKQSVKLEKDSKSSSGETKCNALLKVNDMENRMYIPRLKIPTFEDDLEFNQSLNKVTEQFKSSIPRLEETTFKASGLSLQDLGKKSEDFKPNFLQRIEERIKLTQFNSIETSKEEEKSLQQRHEELKSLIIPARLATSQTDSFGSESLVETSDIDSDRHEVSTPELVTKDLEISVKELILLDKKALHLFDTNFKPALNVPKLDFSSLREPDLKISTVKSVLKSIQITEYQVVPKLFFNIAIVEEVYYPNLSFESYKQDSSNSQISVDIEVQSSYEKEFQEEPNSIQKSELFEDSSLGIIFSNQKPSELNPIQETDISLSYQPSDLLQNLNSVDLHTIDDIITHIILSEIDNYILPYFHEEKTEVDSSIYFLKNYLTNVQNQILPDQDTFLDIYNSPMPIDFLQKLTFFQNAEIGALVSYPSLELILPPEINDQMKDMYAESTEVYKRIYCQMLFDCLNEALNYVRPYGVNGEPAPWSCKERTVYNEEDIDKIFETAKKMLKKWVSIKAGHLPTPEVENISGLIDEAKLQQLREERLSVLLCNDVYNEEKKWIDYEDEEVQAEFDLADILLEYLVEETAGILNDFNE